MGWAGMSLNEKTNSTMMMTVRTCVFSAGGTPEVQGEGLGMKSTPDGILHPLVGFPGDAHEDGPGQSEERDAEPEFPDVKLEQRQNEQQRDGYVQPL